MEGPRILQDGSLRVTENGDRRITEGYAPIDGDASVSSSGTLNLFVERILGANIALSATGSVTVQTQVSVTGSLVAQGSVTVAPTVGVQKALVATSEIEVRPKVVREALTLRSGSGQLEAFGSKVYEGVVNAVASTLLTGNPTVLHSGIVASVPEPRITEDGNGRITQSGDRRVTSDRGAVAGGTMDIFGTHIPFSAGFYAKKNGLWGPVTPYVYFNGAWRTPTVYVKRNGDWLRVY